MPLASAFRFALAIGRETDCSSQVSFAALTGTKVERVAGLAVLATSGTCRAVAERGRLHTASTVPRLLLKLGAGGSEVVARTLCLPPLVPEGESQRKHHHPLHLQIQPPPYVIPGWSGPERAVGSRVEVSGGSR